MQQPGATTRDAEGAGSEAQLRAVGAALEEHAESLLRDARVFAHSLEVPGDRESVAQDTLQAMVETAFRLAGEYDAARPAYPWLRTLLFNQMRTTLRWAIRERKRAGSIADEAARVMRERRTAGEEPLGPF